MESQGLRDLSGGGEVVWVGGGGSEEYRLLDC